MIKNFKKIGEYVSPDEDPIYEPYIGFNKYKKVPLVYLFVVNKKIKYIGETRRGYSRPLSYNKNPIMSRQKNAIYQETKNGNKIEIYALIVPNISLEVNGTNVDSYLAQDYEKVLIKKHKPEWNGRL